MEKFSDWQTQLNISIAMFGKDQKDSKNFERPSPSETST